MGWPEWLRDESNNLDILGLNPTTNTWCKPLLPFSQKKKEGVNPQLLPWLAGLA